MDLTSQVLQAIAPKDRGLLRRYVGSSTPDLVIAPAGKPFLYRWYITPPRSPANVYFHLQVASDPERPLHDHPWANHSVVLIGGYDETYNSYPALSKLSALRRLRVGDVVARPATEAHRLVLPPGISYTMTLFSTGPKIREWGFWYPDGWHDHRRHVADRDGVSVHINRGGDGAQLRMAGL